MAPSDDPKGEVTFDLRFDMVAVAYAGVFFVTMVLGGFATYFATDFTPGKDKIMQYYGFFNPCLLFDHYPAKALAMAGIGFFIVIGILFSLMFFIRVYLEKNLTTILWTAMVTSYVTAMQLLFVNVFTVNLYPEALPQRRLHGGHEELMSASAALTSSMSARNVELVELHTLFYIGWIMAELVFMIHMAAKFFSADVRNWIVWTFLAVSVYGAGFHALAMLVMILQNRPMVDWYFKPGGLGTQLEYVIVWIDAKTFTAVWGWLPIMLYRLMFTDGLGLRFTLSKEKQSKGDMGRVRADDWCGRGMRASATLMGVGGIFTPAFAKNNTLLFKLGGVLRAKPFAYFAAPVFLASVIYFGMGVLLTGIHQRLLDGKTSWPLLWTGMVLVFSQFACVLVVLEEERFTWFFFFVSVVALAAWVLLINHRRNRLGRAAAHVTVGLAVLIAAMATDWWPLYYVWLAILATGEHVLEDDSRMYLSVVALVRDREVTTVADDNPDRIYQAIGDQPVQNDKGAANQSNNA